MRLIDADALWMEVIHAMDYCDDILEIIEHQKTIEPTHLNDSNTLETLDCIGRQEAIDAMYALVDGCERDDEWKENPHIDAIIDTLENLPSVQQEYEPVKVKDFAKTMSGNALYSFLAWYGEALELENRMSELTLVCILIIISCTVAIVVTTFRR